MKKVLMILMLALFCIPWAANAQQSLPYSYGFEDNNLATDGWTAQISSSSSGINSAAAHTGSLGFRFQYSENPGYLVSPLLTGGDRGIDLSFYYKEYSSSYGDENFQVGYTTDANETDPSNFTYGEIIEASTSWQEFTGSFPAGTVRIAIKYLYVDAFYLYLDDFTFEATNPCAKPTNLAVSYEGGTTANVTWDGEARSYNIDVNGTVTNGVSSPYRLSNLEPATTYTVTVQADCGEEQSGWATAVSFFTDCDVASLPFFCGFEAEAEYGCWTMANTESGTGLATGTDYVHAGTYGFAFAYGNNPPQYLISPEFAGTSAMNVSFYYKIRSTDYPETFQVGYSTTTNETDAFTWETEVTATNASEWLEYETTFPNGTKYVAIRYNSNDMWYLFLDDFSFEVFTGCGKPAGLEANQIGTNSAVLNWNGDNNSYVLQYRTGAHDNMDQWEQVGNDVIATATLTQYTFDLSDYSGTGNIAIRHYNISDMFRLAVDDIVVTDANGQEVVNEDFEDGSIPSTWTNYDLDGDGYVWAAIHFDSQVGNGDYVGVSDSWQSGVGALTPDNWLVIPNVELGGTLTFYAKGVDSNFPQENFGVFVTTASLETVFATTPAGDWSADITTTENSYELTSLTASTPYEWRVKGVCEDAESGWASSSFSTIAEGFKTFITEGNWDVDENWFPVGVPAITDEVSIEANVTIPAGVVAVAKRATLNGGSITIEDGGQLKQGAATLRVTVEKEIEGGNYSFISSPFSGRTLYQESGTWSRVDNLLDGAYDFYAFDPTADLEWINYEASPTHISFESDNGNSGMMYGEGYLYANQSGTTLEFVGTTGKSIDYSETKDYTFDETSTSPFNGLILVGNFFSCNAYINYVDEGGVLQEANLYVLNQNGDGFMLANSNELAPATAAFLKVNASGKIQYSTEPIDASPALDLTEDPCLPGLPTQGEETNQDASCVTPLVCKILVDADNPTWIEDFEGYDITTTEPERWTGVLPDCWTVPVQYTGTTDTLPQIYHNFNTTDNGEYSLRMHFRYMLAMPELDENVDLGKIRLNMNVRQPYYAYKLQIGVITDMDNPETSFVPVAVVNNSGKNMTNFECSFASVSNLVGAGRHIAFKNIGGSSNDLYCTNYMDDVTLTYVNVDDLECELYPNYNEDFETYAVGAEPDCWEVITEDVALESTTRPQVYAGYNTTPSGSKSLRLKNRCVYAMPEFIDGYSLSDFTMTFKLRQPKSIYRLQVGVVDAQGNFKDLVTFKCPNTTGFEEMTVNFADYELQGNRIAFRNTLVPGTGKRTDYLDYSINYIDDINFSYNANGRSESNAGAFDAEGSLEDIAVYPNPTTGNLYIDAIGIQKVECYNAMGQLVRVYDNVRNSIDLNNLSEGVYTLRITVPQGVTVRKVVKR